MIPISKWLMTFIYKEGHNALCLSGYFIDGICYFLYRLSGQHLESTHLTGNTPPPNYLKGGSFTLISFCFLWQEHMWGLGALQVLPERSYLPTPPVFFLPQRVCSSHSLDRECLVHGLLLPHRCSVSQDCSGILLLGKVEGTDIFFPVREAEPRRHLGKVRLLPLEVK